LSTAREQDPERTRAEILEVAYRTMLGDMVIDYLSVR